MGSPKNIFERAIRFTKLVTLLSFLPSLFGQGNTVTAEILVKTGDSPAGSDIAFGSIEEIDFNEGLATFVADDGNGNDGIFQMTASDAFALRVIEGESAPGITIPPANTEQANFNNIPVTSFSPSVLFSADASGQIAFKAELDFFSDTLWIQLPGFDPQIVAGGAFNFPITSEATYQSGVTGASHTGHMTLMNQDIPAINQSGDLAFWGALLTDDVNVSSSGLFVRSGLGATSNILISGDPVPGQPGMFFTSAGFGSSAFSVEGQRAFQDDGTLYFRASLVDDLGNPSVLERSFWRKNDSTLSLLAKEDMSAPGFDNRTMERLGLYPSNESRFAIFGRAVAEDLSWVTGYWSGTAMENLQLVFSTRDTTDPNTLITTTEGDAAFSSLSSPRTNSLGELIAFGDATTNSGNPRGIWRWNPINGEISLAVEEGASPAENLIFQSPSPIAINDEGDILFRVSVEDFLTSDTLEGLWVRTSSGEFLKLVQFGDTIGGLSVAQIDFQNLSIDENGAVAIRIWFGDFTIEGIVKLSYGPPEPTDNFLWSGQEGDSDWHKPLNWDDKDTSQDATRDPGDEDGGDAVTINDATVDISNESVRIATITSTGSLSVNAALQIDQDSSIQNIDINAVLTVNGDLDLTGTNSIWRSGTIQGTGSVTETLGDLTIEPTNSSVDLWTTLKVTEKTIQKQGALNLIGGNSLLEIEPTGTYTIESGSITDDSDGIHISNSGIFEKTTASDVIIDAFYENKPNSIMLIKEGSLDFTDPANLAGDLTLSADTTVTLSSSPILLGDPVGQGLYISAGDRANVFFNNTPVILSANTITTFDASGNDASITIENGSDFSGSGSLLNKGMLEVSGGSISSDIQNSGTFILQNGSDLQSNESRVFENLVDAILQKSGSEESVIGPNTHLVDTLGNIIVKEGNLRIDGALTLDGSFLQAEQGTSINFSSTGSPLEVEGDTNFNAKESNNAEPQILIGGRPLQIAANKTLELIGPGTVVMNGTQIELSAGSSIINRIDEPNGSLDIDQSFKITSPEEQPATVENRGILKMSNGSIEDYISVRNYALPGSGSSNEASLFIEDPENRLSFDGAVLRNEIGAKTVQTGLLHFSEGITSGEMGELVNLGTYIIDGSAMISTFDSGGKITNGQSGSFIKLGSGEIDIEPQFSNEGEIIIEAGTLQFTKQLSLSSGSKVIIKETASLLVDSERDGLFEKALISVSGGEASLQSAIGNSSSTVKGSISIEDAATLVIETALDWEPNLMLFVNEDGIASPSTLDHQGILQIGGEGTGQFSLLPSTDTASITGNGRLIIKPGSAFSQNSDLKYDGDIQTEIYGVYNLKTGSIEGSMDNDLFWLNSSGSLIASATNHRIKTGFRVDPGGRVETDSGATLVIDDSGGHLPSPSNSLSIGHWVLGTDSQITIDDGRSIQSIGRDAILELSSGSVFHNLPNVTGDFSVDQGGALILRNTAVFSAIGSFVNAGALTLDGGSLNAGTGFELASTGLLIGNGTINGNLVTNGMIIPGTSPGTITIDGNYQQNVEGELVIELGGTTPGVDYDQLVVSGTATLAGCLRIQCSDETFPANGVEFSPLTATQIIGSFDEIIYDLPSSRQLFEVEIVANELTASASTLNVATYSEWQAGVFTDSQLLDPAISGPDADPDKDGLPNRLEYAIDKNPLVSNSGPTLTVVLDDSGIPVSATAAFDWANGMTDATYELQTSSNLVDWTTLQSQVLDSEDQGLSTRTSISANLGEVADEYIRFAAVFIE